MAAEHRDHFFRDSSILLVGTVFLAGLNFFFQVYMSRALGPVGYGMLGTIFSIFYIVSAASGAIIYSLTKFFAQFNAQNDRSAIRTLFLRAVKKFNLFGFLVFLFFALGAGPLAEFLKFSSVGPIILLAFFLWGSFFFPAVAAFLSGLQKFLPLAILQVTGGLIKLVLGLILVMAGLGLNGAIGALIASVLIPFLMGFFWLGPYLKAAPTALDTGPIYRYSRPVLITSLCLTFYLNFDLILVKHFFNSIEAGFYAAAGTLAKTIYFGTISLTTVMFPKVIDRRELGQNSLGLLFKAAGFFLIGALFCLGIFYFIPDFMGRLVFGGAYQLKNILFPLGVAVALFSLVNILATYLLAAAPKNLPVILSVFALGEVVLIWFQHGSLRTVIHNLTGLMAVLAVILMIMIYGIKKQDDAGQ